MALKRRAYTGSLAQVTKHRRVGGHGDRDATYGVNLSKTASS